MLPSAPLRCDVGPLLTYLLRGTLLRNGCSLPEAEAVTVQPYALAGEHPVLAVIYVADPQGARRELHRVYDMDDLDRFLADGLCCPFLARSVRSIAGDSS